jgi:hypothetical protein
MLRPPAIASGIAKSHITQKGAPMTSHWLSRRLMPACAAILLFAPPVQAQFQAQAPAAAAAPAAASNVPAPGMARVWFYREMQPYSSLATPYVRLNGVVAGVSEPGGAFHVDVPPGHYHLSADSIGVDFNQTRDVDLAPGMQIFAKVVSNDNWIEGGGGRGGGGYHRDTFYVWLYPVETAWPVIQHGYIYGAGPLTAALPR